jgi:predicted CXXCH cytochrome family protein
MENNHPVGVSRPADKIGFTPFNPSPTNDANGVDYDANGYVQCGSCHNPHAYDDIAKPFLRKSNANSALCRTCHNL